VYRPVTTATGNSKDKPYTTLIPPAQFLSGGNVPLNITYQGNDTSVEDNDTVLIGSDAASTIRIVRPGISRKHAVVSFDGDSWKVEDAGSRNGVFADGQRIQTVIIDGPTTLYLGHPTDGEAISLSLVTNGAAAPTDAGESSIQDEIDAFVITEKPKKEKSVAPGAAASSAAASSTATSPPPPASRTRVQPVSAAAPSDADIASLTAALRDQISVVKGLTWSVWAMIAVTAALAVMTLFVGILGN
jgi:hypothetical protein